MIGKPTRQHILGDFAGGKSKHDRGCGFLAGVKVDAVKPEKHDHRSQRRALVAVDEGMIARDAEPVCRRKDGESGFAIREFMNRPCQRGFEQTDIADAVDAAEKRKLLGVEIKNEIDVEPSRLAHFASAL